MEEQTRFLPDSPSPKEGMAADQQLLFPPLIDTIAQRCPAYTRWYFFLCFCGITAKTLPRALLDKMALWQDGFGQDAEAVKAQTAAILALNAQGPSDEAYEAVSLALEKILPHLKALLPETERANPTRYRYKLVQPDYAACLCGKIPDGGTCDNCHYTPPENLFQTIPLFNIVPDNKVLSQQILESTVVFQMLISCKNINAKHKNTLSASHYLSYCGCLALVVLFEQHGANLNLKTSSFLYGEKPFGISYRKNAKIFMSTGSLSAFDFAEPFHPLLSTFLKEKGCNAQKSTTKVFLSKRDFSVDSIEFDLSLSGFRLALEYWFIYLGVLDLRSRPKKEKNYFLHGVAAQSPAKAFNDIKDKYHPRSFKGFPEVGEDGPLFGMAKILFKALPVRDVFRTIIERGRGGKPEKALLLEDKDGLTALHILAEKNPECYRDLLIYSEKFRTTTFYQYIKTSKIEIPLQYMAATNPNIFLDLEKQLLERNLKAFIFTREHFKTLYIFVRKNSHLSAKLLLDFIDHDYFALLEKQEYLSGLSILYIFAYLQPVYFKDIVDALIGKNKVELLFGAGEKDDIPLHAYFSGVVTNKRGDFLSIFLNLIEQGKSEFLFKPCPQYSKIRMSNFLQNIIHFSPQEGICITNRLFDKGLFSLITWEPQWFYRGVSVLHPLTQSSEESEGLLLLMRRVSEKSPEVFHMHSLSGISMLHLVCVNVMPRLFKFLLENVSFTQEELNKRGSAQQNHKSKKMTPLEMLDSNLKTNPKQKKACFTVLRELETTAPKIYSELMRIDDPKGKSLSMKEWIEGSTTLDLCKIETFFKELHLDTKLTTIGIKLQNNALHIDENKIFTWTIKDEVTKKSICKALAIFKKGTDLVFHSCGIKNAIKFSIPAEHDISQFLLNDFTGKIKYHFETITSFINNKPTSTEKEIQAIQERKQEKQKEERRLEEEMQREKINRKQETRSEKSSKNHRRANQKDNHPDQQRRKIRNAASKGKGKQETSRNQCGTISTQTPISSNPPVTNSSSHRLLFFPGVTINYIEPKVKSTENAPKIELVSKEEAQFKQLDECLTLTPDLTLLTVTSGLSKFFCDQAKNVISGENKAYIILDLALFNIVLTIFSKLENDIPESRADLKRIAEHGAAITNCLLHGIPCELDFTFSLNLRNFVKNVCDHKTPKIHNEVTICRTAFYQALEPRSKQCSADIKIEERLKAIASLLSLASDIQKIDSLFQEVKDQAHPACIILVGEHFAQLLEVDGFRKSIIAKINADDSMRSFIALLYQCKMARNGFKHRGNHKIVEDGIAFHFGITDAQMLGDINKSLTAFKQDDIKALVNLLLEAFEQSFVQLVT